MSLLVPVIMAAFFMLKQLNGVDAIYAGLNLSGAKRERVDIGLAVLKRSFIISNVVILVVTLTVWYLLSRRVISSIKRVETSLTKLAGGEYEKIFDIDAPNEMLSLAETYNNTVRTIKESKNRLHETLDELKSTNAELVNRQEELLQSRNMAAIKLLASEIAHEVSNPLTSISVFLGLLKEDVNKDDTCEMITFMLKEVTRAQEIIHRLTDFARKQPLNLREVDVRELVDEATDIVLRQNAGKAVCLTSSLSELPEGVVLDRTFMHQALVNVLSNAFLSTPSGGNVDIRGSSGNGNLVIAVEDTGMGIAPEDLPHIFDPFFTTRKDTGGNGMGLVIARKMIELHGGQITAHSVYGQGATFTITLPVQGGQ
ncbi:integral membrane sensor signal transduction histidine kinase [Candidatus Magnetobacterium bavaricum]|uniref:histidine kinase n=1 Tax=Candidatus Magnetobacterium bavaricum TaxID=29290 RepID=A0A0F3GKB5_9BACT|nr:integral membrane sensor signal transduction histidine kinase [Candidatus Magnetobacterium bavaricum]